MVSEVVLVDMVKFMDFIKKCGLKVVFVELSVLYVIIECIVKDFGVKVGGELFFDVMGVLGIIENGYDVGIYEGMVKYNLNMIVGVLK